MPARRLITDEQELWIVENYATTPNIEFKKKFGIGDKVLHRIRQKYGVRKDDEYCKELNREKCRMMTSFNNTEEARRKRIATLKIVKKEQCKAERRRVMYGLPQRTKMKINLMPQRDMHNKSCCRTRLKKKGYIYMGDNCFTIDNSTERSEMMERNAKQKYGIRFIYEG